MKSTQRRREVWQYLLGHLDWTDSVEKIQMRESRFYDKKLIEVIINYKARQEYYTVHIIFFKNIKNGQELFF